MATERTPLAVDLCCGLGGWTDGLLAEGYRARGYDIEAHEYDGERFEGDLVLRSVLDMHGSEIADADLIVASPPCTEFSYMAMPWSRAKQIGRALRGEDEFPLGYMGSRTREQLTALFDACFRLQREASAAKGEYIPMVLENVQGARPWVGPAKGHYGSYYLWGDVPALPKAVALNDEAIRQGRKHHGDWFRDPNCPSRQGGMKKVAPGRKGAGAGAEWFDGNLCIQSSKSPARKAASARIAKIPFVLARHIAAFWKPLDC